MAIEYLGLSSVNGPFVVLEGVQGASFDEVVEITVDNGGLPERKLGRVVEINEDKAVVQVFEKTENLSLQNTHTRFTGHPMEIGLSESLLGRTFNGIGEPIDNLGEIVAEKRADVNGKPLNPVRREYPRNYIRTGVSAIDGLTTLIRGQKLPIFSGNGTSRHLPERHQCGKENPHNGSILPRQSHCRPRLCARSNGGPATGNGQSQRHCHGRSRHRHYRIS